LFEFLCPICKNPLVRTEKTYICENSHSFDIAKSGYVNLLISQKQQCHGDDKLMVQSRRDFLDKGYYAPLRNALCEQIQKYAKTGSRILDAGAGEGYYSAAVADAAGDNCHIGAIDISKHALTAINKRTKNIDCAVASIYDMPVADSSCQIALNFFAPNCNEELFRILDNGGILIRAIPLRRHLFSLKSAVYDEPYENEPESYDSPPFSLVSAKELRFRINLDSNKDILSLFQMTPYYYKTSKKDYEKLLSLDELETEVEFCLLTYEKKL